jgi:hypothetical protein
MLIASLIDETIGITSVFDSKAVCCIGSNDGQTEINVDPPPHFA